MTSVVGGRRLDDWATEAPYQLNVFAVKLADRQKISL